MGEADFKADLQLHILVVEFVEAVAPAAFLHRDGAEKVHRACGGRIAVLELQRDKIDVLGGHFAGVAAVVLVTLFHQRDFVNIAFAFLPLRFELYPVDRLVFVNVGIAPAFGRGLPVGERGGGGRTCKLAAARKLPAVSAFGRPIALVDAHLFEKRLVAVKAPVFQISAQEEPEQAVELVQHRIAGKRFNISGFPQGLGKQQERVILPQTGGAYNGRGRIRIGQGTQLPADFIMGGLFILPLFGGVRLFPLPVALLLQQAEQAVLLTADQRIGLPAVVRTAQRLRGQKLRVEREGGNPAGELFDFLRAGRQRFVKFGQLALKGPQAALNRIALPREAQLAVDARKLLPQEGKPCVKRAVLIRHVVRKPQLAEVACEVAGGGNPAASGIRSAPINSQKFPDCLAVANHHFGITVGIRGRIVEIILGPRVEPDRIGTTAVFLASVEIGLINAAVIFGGEASRQQAVENLTDSLL